MIDTTSIYLYRNFAKLKQDQFSVRRERELNCFFSSAYPKKRAKSLLHFLQEFILGGTKVTLKWCQMFGPHKVALKMFALRYDQRPVGSGSDWLRSLKYRSHESLINSHFGLAQRERR